MWGVCQGWENSADSLWLKWRQWHPRGFKIMDQTVRRYFIHWADEAHYAYLTQCVQALGVGISIEAQRKAIPYCMGILFWQLNKP